MIQLQTDYAKAMEPFGLVRGEFNSRASHQDLQTFYRALNNVVRKKLPSKEQFPDDQTYQKEIDKIYQETVMRMFALEQSIKRLEAVDKTRESNQSIYREMTEARIKDYEEQIKILSSNLSEAEKKAKITEYIQLSIAELEKRDPKKAKEEKDRLNEHVRAGGHASRAFDRKVDKDTEQTPGKIE